MLAQTCPMTTLTVVNVDANTDRTHARQDHPETTKVRHTETTQWSASMPGGGRAAWVPGAWGVGPSGHNRGMATVFTKIIDGELPGRFVWQDDQVVAFLSIAPLTTGHTLVVPRKESDDWTALDAGLAGHLMVVAGTIGAALRAAFDAPRAGLVIAGFEVPHVHLHVFPAWNMDDFDFHKARTDVPAAEFDAARERILDALGGQGTA